MTTAARPIRPAGGDDPRSERRHAVEVDGRVTLVGLPEVLFGATALELVEDEVVGSIDAGPWLSWGGEHGAAGSLGVLVDVVLGYAIVRNRPEGMSSVSTEITIDLLGNVPLEGRLEARGTQIHRDERGGLARGDVRSGDGTLIAVATQRGRFVPTGEVAPPSQSAGKGRECHSGLSTLLWPDGGSPLMDADTHHVAVSPQLANHLGNLHGGISLLLAETAAFSAVRRAGAVLSTASIHVVYVRPVPLGSAITLKTSIVHRGRSSGVVHVLGQTQAGKPGFVATVTLH